MSIFDNKFRPDNPLRMQRATELANDCAFLGTQISEETDSIQALVAVDGEIQKLYEKITKTNDKPGKIDLGNSLALDVGGFSATVLGSIYAGRAASQALDAAFVGMLVRRGRIGEAAFSRIVGLPNWFRAGSFAGGLAGSIAVGALIDAGFAAWSDEEKHDRYRQAIHSLVEPRVKLQKTLMGAKALNASLLRLKFSLEDLQEEGVDLKDAEALEDVQRTARRCADKANAALKEITDEKAKASLKAMDDMRKSWNAEDYA